MDDNDVIHSQGAINKTLLQGGCDVMRLDFQGRKVLITGSSKGIGAATAKLFGESGATVGVHYRSDRAGAEEVAAAVRASGGRAILLSGDVTKENDCVQLVERFAEEAGGIDVLVNNAGAVLKRVPATDYDVETFNATLNLNVTSAFVCTRAAIPYLRKSDGASVILLSSVASRFGPTNVVAYAAAKSAINGMTMCLARELAPDGIRVNAVAPGVIDTPFHRHTPPERLQQLTEMMLIKRLGKPEEVASVILFLASPAASYITGECIEVNGGMYMRCG